MKMKKRIFVVLTVTVLPFMAKAYVLSLPSNNNIHTNTPVVLAQQDTVVTDLEDLEAIMPDTLLENDTTDYFNRIPTPKGYDGLRYVLDRRHRYVGDKFVSNSFWRHTYFTFGGGAAKYLVNDDFHYTPFANIHLGFGKDFSPMNSIRLSVEGGWGFTKDTGIISSLTTYKSLGAHFDYLFNFTNYLLGYRPERGLTVSGAIGLGVQNARLTGTAGSGITNFAITSGTSYDARLGLQFKMTTSPHASFALEPFIKVGTRKQDLVVGSHFNSMDFSYGANLSYIWYFWPELSKEKNAGNFMHRFEEGERLFYEQYAKKHWRRPIFFEYSVGPVWYDKMDIPMKSSMGYTGNAYLGWWLSSAIGVRAGIHIVNTDWADNSQVPNSGLRTKSLLGVRGAVFDLLFNPFGFKRNYNWDSSVGLNLIAGYEFGRMRVVNSEHNNYVRGNFVGYRFGGQLWLKLTNDMRLNAEPTYTFIEQYQGLSARKQYGELGLKLGVSVLFRDKANREKFNLDSIEVRDRYSPTNGYFWGVGLGWNTTVHTWRYANGDNPLLKNAILFGGYNIDAYHGVRLSGEYITDLITMPGNSGNAIGNKTMKNTLLSLDYQLNLMNLFAGYDPYRRWNVYLYGGPSLAFGSVGTEFAVNFGGMLTYNVSHNLALFYSHTIYRMHKDRYISSQVYKDEGTFVNSLNVGLMCNINRSFIETALKVKNMLACDYTHQPIFFEYSVGPVWYDRLDNISIGSTLGYTANANIGWWLNSAVGIRGGVHISNADWAHATNEARKNLLGFTSGTLDLMFNPVGITKKYNWNAPVGFNLFGGIGLGKIRFVTDRTHAYETSFREYRMGTQLWLKLTNGLRLNVEPTYSILGNFKGNRVVDKADELAMKVGISMLLRDKSKDKADVAEHDSIPYRPYGFFFGGGIGWNTTAHTWRPTGQGFDRLKNGMFFAGYNFNEYHGIRVSGEYLKDEVWNPEDGGGLSFQEFKNTLLSFDYQFNILNALAGISASRNWDVSIFGGPSWALTDDGSRLAWNFGGILSYNVTKNLSLFYSHTVYRMNKDRYFSAQVYRTPGTVVNSLTIGIQYRFFKSIHKKSHKSNHKSNVKKKQEAV